MTNQGSSRPRYARRVALWILATVFLLLSAWLIPGSLWGTSPDSPLGGGLALLISIPVLLFAVLFLWLAIRAQRQHLATLR